MSENKTGKSKSTLKISLTALFAAFIAGGTFIAIPIGPVPITLQNFFVMLAGMILGPILCAASVTLYLLAGIIGAPVFAGFTGGITRLAGPTGGFLIGYLCMALTAGLIAGNPLKKTITVRIITAAAAGLIVVYIPGLFWLKYSANLNWTKTLAAGLIPFIAGDILKGIAAVLIVPKLRKTAADYLYG